MDGQEKIQQLIQHYEAEITKLLETKRTCSPLDDLYTYCELAIIHKQQFVCDLRSIL